MSQAIPLALATIKDRQGWTPPEIADFLQELLEHHDNSRNPFTADAFLVAVVTALGRLKVGAEQVRYLSLRSLNINFKKGRQSFAFRPHKYDPLSLAPKVMLRKLNL